MTEKGMTLTGARDVTAPENYARKLASIGWYAIRHRLPFLVLVVLAGVVIWAMLAGNPPALTSLVDDWRKKAQPIIGATTFVVAVALWLQQLRRSWHERLPNRLTVVFRHNGSEVFRCERAHLPDPSSIREFAQQIGAHMPDPERFRKLAFRVPYIELANPKRVFDRREERIVGLYQATLELMELPDDITEGQSWVWTYPFGKNDIKLIEESSANEIATNTDPT